MMKYRLKSGVVWSLLMLLSIGLAASTLHSHHDLEFHHDSSNLSDTGHHLTTDSVLCPICGYVLKSFETPDIEGMSFLEPFSIVKSHDVEVRPQRISILVLGRSPPFIA